MNARLYLSLLLVVLAGCSGNLLEPDGREFEITEQGEVRTELKVNKDQFLSSVVGYGWKLDDAREILEDGSISRKSYYPQDGGGPSAYFVEGSSITRYYDVTHSLQTPHRVSTKSYLFENSMVILEDGGIITLLSILKDRITCVEQLLYSGSQSKPVYLYSVYKKMSEKELDYYNETYMTNR